MRKKILSTTLALVLTLAPANMLVNAADTGHEEVTQVVATTKPITSQTVTKPVTSAEPTSSPDFDPSRMPYGFGHFYGKSFTYNKATPGDLEGPCCIEVAFGYKIYVDDEVLTPNVDFVFPSASMGICFKQSFLDTLSIGTHDLELVYYDNVKYQRVASSINVVFDDSTEPNPTDVPPTKPVVSDSPKDLPNIDAVCNTTNSQSSIVQSYTISLKDDSKPIELSKLQLRMFYKNAGSKEQEFYCDNAAMEFNRAPYYQSCTSCVKGAFQDDYLEIAFQSEDELTDGKLSVQARCNQTDWSSYQDVSLEKMEVWYDGQLIETKKL